VIQAKPTFGYPARRVQSALELTVLYTNVRATLTALRRAAMLARDLGATIRILNVRIVPYPLPLEHPPADRDVLSKNIGTLADGQPIPTRVEICFGRDIADSLVQSLSANSIVLIGARMRWWPTKKRSWAKQISRNGHQVIFVPEMSAVGA
jgi:hypothetical protein